MTTQKASEVNVPFDISRRQAMGVLGAISALGVTGFINCAGSSATATGNSLTSLAAVRSSSTTRSILIPSETLATFPLSTILTNSAFLREEIHENKVGVPLTVKVKLVNVNDNDTPLSGYVYIWHCDSDGLYSGHDTQDNPGHSYCRGLQSTDTNGQVSFNTIYPGWDEKRIPHINFQLFLTAPSDSTSLSAVSQMAFPAEINASISTSSLYSKCQNTTDASFYADNVFSEGITYQLATVTGNLEDGYIAELELGLAV
ncbi:MAG TPA: protocatechuate dioxygenase [Cellvibrio sp.]|nr:protocatechuate dioxygenase [Cellvibrio sp.]